MKKSFIITVAIGLVLMLFVACVQDDVDTFKQLPGDPQLVKHTSTGVLYRRTETGLQMLRDAEEKPITVD